MSYAIRTATIEDALAVATVQDATWRDSYRGTGIIPDDVIDGRTALSRVPQWKSWLSEPDRITYIAERDGEAVGIAMFRPYDEEPGFDAQLSLLYVRRAAQRRGLGRALITRGVSELRARGYRSLTLNVIAINVRARAFYEALGAQYLRDALRHEGENSWVDAVYGWSRLPE